MVGDTSFHERLLLVFLVLIPSAFLALVRRVEGFKGLALPVTRLRATKLRVKGAYHAVPKLIFRYIRGPPRQGTVAEMGQVRQPFHPA